LHSQLAPDGTSSGVLKYEQWIKWVDSEVLYMLTNRDFTPCWVFVHRQLFDFRAADEIDSIVQLHTAQGLLDLSPEQAAELYSNSPQYPFSSVSVSKLPTKMDVHTFPVQLTWKLFAPPLDRQDLFNTLLHEWPDPLLAFHHVTWPAFAYVKVQLADPEAALARVIEAGM
jgi:hypothetical protein